MNCCKNSLSCSAKSVLGSQSLPPESRWLLYTFQHARKHCSQLDRRCEGALEGKCRTPRLPQLRAPRPARWLRAGLELSRFGQAGPAGSVPSRALSLRGASALATRTKSSVPAAVPARERPVPALPVRRDPRPSALPRGRAGSRKDRGAGPYRHNHWRFRCRERSAVQGPAAPGEPSPPPPRIPRPPRWREALRAGTATRSTSDCFSPQSRSPTRVPGGDHRPAARLPGPYRGAQGCAPSAGRLQPPSRSPGDCSFFGEAGKRERKGGGKGVGRD